MFEKACVNISCIIILLISASALLHADFDVSIQDEPYTVFRQTDSGWERQVSIIFTNTDQAIESVSAAAAINNNKTVCPLETIPNGESHDVLWIPNENTAVKFNLEIKQNGNTILTKDIDLPVSEPDKVVAIPKSKIIKSIKPLNIRGTNYLPRMYPWPGLYRQASSITFEDDFSLLKSLNVNTIRTFLFFDPDNQNDTGAEYGLYRKDGSATAKTQKLLSDILSMADKYNIKVVLNVGSLPPLEDISTARRMYKTALGPFINDGRILMFDVMNEPGGNDGPKANATLSNWLQHMYEYSRKIMPNHLLTVGLCWQFDQLWDLGIYPDVAQYHDYSGAIGIQPKNKPEVRTISGDLARNKKFIGNRPLLIGEFGISTEVSEPRGVDEAKQKAIYQGIFDGAEDQKIIGVMNWTLFDFIPDWMGKFERKFGIVRADDTLKPAGVLLKSTYKKWAEKYPASWDVKSN